MRILILALVAIAASGAAAPAQSVYDPGGYPPYPSGRSTLTQPLFTQPYVDSAPVYTPPPYHGPETWIGSHTPAMDIWNNGRGDTIVCHKTPYTTICQ